MKRRTTVVISSLIIGAMGLGGTALAGTTGMLGHSVGAGSPRYGTTIDAYGPAGMMGTATPGGMMASPTPGPGGMMGNGTFVNMWTNCYPGGMMGGATQSNPQGRTLTLTQAQQHVQGYIAQYNMTSLAVDEVMEFQKNFYAIVKDKSTGHGAFEVLVNKVTGAVCPEYGPAMMWNTQYGMTRGMRGYQQPGGPMTVAPAEATRIAMQWLQRTQPGTATEKPEQFPGYYTVHILRSGKVTGMLSVNGFTGQVWYHTWHGALIQMKDLHA